MPYAQSERAVQTLESLGAQPDRKVTLSFSENASLLTAEWATRKFAAHLLVDKVTQGYRAQPEVDDKGRPIDIEDLEGIPGERLRAKQETAEIDGQDIADDLKLAARRVARGYDLGQVAFHGVDDTSAIIGSLERAVEIHPENLSPSEQYRQAAAQYMLDHMQVIDADISNSRSFLL